MCAAGKYGMQGAISAAEAACTACEAGKYSDAEGLFITLYTSLLSPASTGSMLAEVAVGLVCMYVCVFVCMHVLRASSCSDCVAGVYGVSGRAWYQRGGALRLK